MRAAFGEWTDVFGTCSLHGGLLAVTGQTRPVHEFDLPISVHRLEQDTFDDTSSLKQDKEKFNGRLRCFALASSHLSHSKNSNHPERGHLLEGSCHVTIDSPTLFSQKPPLEAHQVG